MADDIKRFEGFSEATLNFMMGIRLNNNLEFYEAHKDEYKQVLLEPLQTLCAQLAPLALEVDSTLDTRVSRCVSRLRRDTRFAKDKSPYRDNAWFCYRHSGDNMSEDFIYFFEISLDGYIYGVGSYGPSKPLMDAAREWIKQNPDAAEKLFAPLAEKGYIMEGESYKRIAVPQLPPHAEQIYKMKFFSAMRRVTDTKGLMTGALADELSQAFADLKQLYLTMQKLRTTIVR